MRFNYKEIDSKRIIENVALLFYKGILDYAFVFFLCVVFGYQEIYYVDFSLTRFCESWVWLFVVMAVRPKRRSITSYYLLMQTTIMVIPMLTVYGLTEYSRVFLYIVCCLHCLQCVMENVSYVKIENEYIIKNGGLILGGLVLLLGISSVVYTFLTFGIPGWDALNFSNVYIVREENVPSGIFSYVVGWFFCAVFPAVLVYGMEKKRIILMILFSAEALFLYLTYAHKSWLLAGCFVVAVYFVVKRGGFSVACCVGLPVMVSGCLLCYKISKSFLILPSMFIRRLLVVPAVLKFEYYEYFKNREKLHFSEGLIGKIIGLKSPYEKEIALIIGDEIGQSGSSCNTGYLADAYANAGVFGMFLFAVLLFVILKMLDICLKKEGLAVNFSILSYCLFGLNDGALLTRVVTGGMGLLIVMLFLRKRSENNCNIEMKSLFRTD